MKTKKKLFVPALLICTMLAGCAGNGAPERQAEAETSVPETTVMVENPASAVEETVPVVATEETQAPFAVTVTPVIATQQTQVTVTTADEFLAAIGSDTEIIVEAERIDLSTAAGYGSASTEYYRWDDPFDGPELVITGVSNLTIRGAGEDRTATVISAVPRYADVLTFENCSNIHVKGITAGHTEEPGYCLGGVLFFQNSQNILVENCGLFGCGTVGVNAYSSKDIQIVNNEIYECSVGGVEFTNCDMVNVDGNTFRDIDGPAFRIYDCGTITCNGEPAVPFQW